MLPQCAPHPEISRIGFRISELGKGSVSPLVPDAPVPASETADKDRVILEQARVLEEYRAEIFRLREEHQQHTVGHV